MARKTGRHGVVLINYAFMLNDTPASLWERLGKPTTLDYTQVEGTKVNLWQVMGEAARQDFLKKLNDKMEVEYERWRTGHYN
jgi:hypothetical protein